MKKLVRTWFFNLHLTSPVLVLLQQLIKRWRCKNLRPWLRLCSRFRLRSMVVTKGALRPKGIIRTSCWRFFRLRWSKNWYRVVWTTTLHALIGYRINVKCLSEWMNLGFGSWGRKFNIRIINRWLFRHRPYFKEKDIMHSIYYAFYYRML